jgi:hypothetical protein
MLNVEVGGLRFKDQLLWNIKDTSITPRTFAAQLCMDEELPLTCADEIAQSVQHQLDQYNSIAEVSASVSSLF